MCAAQVRVSLPEDLSPVVFPAGVRLHTGGMELPPVVAASRLATRPMPAMVATGIAQLDALTGGLPRGALSEICGPASSGRTSVLLALLAAMSERGEACALVDASDSFDPQSAQAAGVDLRRLLWVRCSPQRHRGTEKNISYCQVSSADCGRQPNRNLQITNRKSQMDSLEQALKATDLLLQGGGFGVVAVDLGDVPPQAARRVPLTSWFRFRRSVENTGTVLLVMEQEPYAKTCASVVIQLSAFSSRLSARQPIATRVEQQPAHARILGGLEITAELLRSPGQQKKTIQSLRSQWASRTVWAG